MNILYIDHYVGSPEYGMEYRPYYLAREWAKAGHSVRMLGADRSHLRIKEPQLEGAFAKESIDGIEYFWIKTPAYEGNGFGRIWNMLAFLTRAWRYKRVYLDGWKPDAVIASSTYPLDNYLAAMITGETGARHIYEVHDLWPLSPIELGGYSKLHPFVVVMQAAENYAYRKCDAVVSLLPAAEPHMREHGLAAGKYSYVPNGIDIAEWEAAHAPLPQAHADAIARSRKEGRCIVMYAGGHGISNSLDHYLDAAKTSGDMTVDFYMVGSGQEKDRLVRRIQDEGIANLISLPAVKKACLPSLLAEADVLYVGHQRQSLYRFGVSPNKVMDYMMAGKPVVQAIEAANNLVGEAGCGMSIRAEDSNAILEAVRTIVSMSDADKAAIGKRGRDYALANHDYRVLAIRFLEVLAGGK